MNSIHDPLKNTEHAKREMLAAIQTYLEFVALFREYIIFFHQ